jgi:hypothetical protein
VFEMSRLATFVFLLTALLALGCREEGAVEKAGRKLDDALDELTHPNEGPLERLGRRTDEAFEDVKDKLEGE